MKICKTVLSLAFAMLISITIVQAQCGNLYIAGILDGPLPGGSPKGIQLCATGAIADLSIYGLESVANGNGSAGTEEYTFDAVALASGDCVWLTNDMAQFTAFFGFNACYENDVIAVNGDDAVLLYCSTFVEDVAGDPDTDGSGTNWEYLDGWMYSNDTDANSSFDETEWDYSGPDALDGETDNSSAAIPYPNTAINCPVLMVDCAELGLNIGAACDDADPTTSNDTVTASCTCEGEQSDEALCFTDTACDFEIVAVAMNSQADNWSCNAGSYEANGFVGSGTDETSNLWLISGVYDFSGSANITLQLDAVENFNGSNIEIYYTTTYTGCPGDASNNWVSASVVASGAGGTGLAIDLSGSAGSASVYIGIQYLSGSAPATASGWTVSNISLIADSCPTINAPVTSGCNTGIGCTDAAACNYNATATTDDGSCFSIGDTCDDGDSSTTNDVYIDCISCQGTQSGDAMCFTDTTCDFEIVAVAVNSESDNWTCNAGSYEANGFVGSGTDETSDLWLISGVYDFTGSSSISLQLDATEGFNGSNIEIFYTATYSGCPGDASNNWTSAVLIASGSGGTGLSIDLSGMAGSANAYIGIQYLSGSAPADASNWTVENISILADSCPVLGSPIASGCDTGAGCTNVDACNYDANATADDGTCIIVGDSCDDGNAATANDVYTDCNTCQGTAIVAGDCPDSAKINEFHYDNAGDDLNEFVEIALPSNSDPTQVQVNLYNGSNGSSYEQFILSSNEFVSTDGTFDYYVWIPENFQNGNDGIALSCIDGTQYQFITYEGSFMATDGPFAGMDGTDTGVEETNTSPETSSIMCDGSETYLTN